MSRSQKAVRLLFSALYGLLMLCCSTENEKNKGLKGKQKGLILKKEKSRKKDRKKELPPKPPEPSIKNEEPTTPPSHESEINFMFKEPLLSYIKELLEICKDKNKATQEQLNVQSFLLEYCQTATTALSLIHIAIDHYDKLGSKELLSFLYASPKIKNASLVHWGSVEAPLYRAIRNCLETTSISSQKFIFDLATFLFENEARIPASQAMQLLREAIDKGVYILIPLLIATFDDDGIGINQLNEHGNTFLDEAIENQADSPTIQALRVCGAKTAFELNPPNVDENDSDVEDSSTTSDRDSVTEETTPVPPTIENEVPSIAPEEPTTHVITPTIQEPENINSHEEDTFTTPNPKTESAKNKLKEKLNKQKERFRLLTKKTLSLVNKSKKPKPSSPKTIPSPKRKKKRNFFRWRKKKAPLKITSPGKGKTMPETNLTQSLPKSKESSPNLGGMTKSPPVIQNKRASTPKPSLEDREKARKLRSQRALEKEKRIQDCKIRNQNREKWLTAMEENDWENVEEVACKVLYHNEKFNQKLLEEGLQVAVGNASFQIMTSILEGFQGNIAKFTYLSDDPSIKLKDRYNLLDLAWMVYLQGIKTKHLHSVEEIFNMIKVIELLKKYGLKVSQKKEVLEQAIRLNQVNLVKKMVEKEKFEISVESLELSLQEGKIAIFYYLLDKWRSHRHRLTKETSIQANQALGKMMYALIESRNHEVLRYLAATLDLNILQYKGHSLLYYAHKLHITERTGKKSYKKMIDTFNRNNLKMSLNEMNEIKKLLTDRVTGNLLEEVEVDLNLDPDEDELSETSKVRMSSKTPTGTEVSISYLP